jgi:hypothetical protein
MKIALACGLIMLMFGIFSMTQKPYTYNCKYVTYPVAIDIPQEVIRQCQKRRLL